MFILHVCMCVCDVCDVLSKIEIELKLICVYCARETVTSPERKRKYIYLSRDVVHTTRWPSVLQREL